MPLRLVGGKLVNDDGQTVTTDDVTAAPASEPSDGFRCEDCGTPLVYSGRGRHPRYCDEHKTVSPNRGRAGTTPRRSTTLRNESQLREALTARYLMLSNIAALRHPAYATSIRDKIERAVEADIAYAKVNPSFRRVLESGLEKTAAAEVIAVHVSMFAPVIVGEAANRGRKKATSGRGEASRPSPAPPRANATPPPNSAPATPSQPTPENVRNIRRVPDDGLFPAEHEGNGEPESTEYDTLPDANGMPSV